MISDILRQAKFPGPVLVLDFEAYFDKKYSMAKRDTTTIDFVTDERFEFTGLGLRVLNHPLQRLGSVFVDGLRVPKTIDKLKKAFGRGFHNCTVVGANLFFDALILQHHFNIVPPYLIDIQSLSRYYDSKMKHSVAAQAKMHGLKSKGDTNRFKGLHTNDMTEQDRRDLKEYCLGDVDIEADLFNIYLPMIDNPEIELWLMSHTLRLYLNPILEMDYELAGSIKGDMQKLLAEKMGKIKKSDGSSMEVGDFRKPRIFVPVLQNLLPTGEDVPMKTNKNGKPIPAMAKTDPELEDLKNHESKAVREFAEAKVAAQSWPNHIKRIDNLVLSAKRSKDLVRIPLKYCGSHTARWSGSEAVNVQNLGGKGRGPGMNALIGKVRHCLRAPFGKRLVIVDAAQIEARALAWIAGQDDLVQGFANNGDVYSEFASTLFGVPVWKNSGDKEIDVMRGFGKDGILGCVAEGTPILTANGWTPIEKITNEWGLWDGHEWNLCDGVVNRGIKQCIKVGGIWLTPEHEILTGGGWTTAAELSTRNLNQGWFTESLQWFRSQRVPVGGSSPSNVVAPVVEYLLRQGTIWSPENQYAVMSVLKEHPAKLRVIARLWMSLLNHDCLAGFLVLLADAILNRITDMVEEVLEYGPSGSRIESLFLNTWQRCRATMIQTLRSTGLTTTPGIDRAISDLLRESSKLETRNATCYDILNAGPKNRFVAGDLIVSNCGYGMGKNTFYDRCYSNTDLRPMFDSGKYDLRFIEKLINTYRKKYSKIPEFWNAIEKCFRWPIKHPHQPTTYSRYGRELLRFSMNGSTLEMTLPSGRRMFYRHAMVTSDGSIKYQAGIKWHHLWGGAITENLIQALCRDLLAGWIRECEGEWLKVVHHCHDEIVTIASETKAEEVFGTMMEIMSNGPEWAKGFPFAAEGEISEYYKK